MAKKVSKPAQGAAGKDEKEGKFLFFGIGIDKTTVYLMAGAVLLYFIWLGYVVLTTKPPEFTDYSVEAPLVKNADFSLSPGERYAYATFVNGTKGPEISYEVAAGQGCALLRSGNLSICLKPNGMELGSNSSSNLGYSNKAFPLFKPWMLGVKENWAWAANVTVQIKEVGYSDTLRIGMRSGAKEKKLGRDAYRVDITIFDENENATMKITDWVDADRRVLLEEDLEGVSLRLVGAPFEIENAALTE